MPRNKILCDSEPESEDEIEQKQDDNPVEFVKPTKSKVLSKRLEQKLENEVLEPVCAEVEVEPETDKTIKTKKQKKAEKYDPEILRKNMTCPHCGRIFKSATYMKKHITQNRCKKLNEEHLEKQKQAEIVLEAEKIQQQKIDKRKQMALAREAKKARQKRIEEAVNNEVKKTKKTAKKQPEPIQEPVNEPEKREESPIPKKPLPMFRPKPVRKHIIDYSNFVINFD